MPRALLTAVVLGLAGLAAAPTPAPAGEYAVIRFTAGGRQFVHHRESGGLSRDNTALAAKLVFFDSWRKVALTGSDQVRVSEIRLFATREEARAYQARCEEAGAEPWQGSCRAAAPPVQPQPQPLPQPQPQPWQPQPPPQPQPQPRQPEPQPLPQPGVIRGGLSCWPAEPRVGDSVTLTLSVSDSADNWPAWETSWFVGNQRVGGAGLQTTLRAQNAGAYTVAVLVRNARTGSSGRFAAQVTVAAPGEGSWTPAPGPVPVPPAPFDESAGSRRGPVPGVGGFGRLPGADGLFQALVGIFGPGALTLILYLLSSILGGGGAPVPVALPVPPGPAGPDEDTSGPAGSEPPPADRDAAGPLPGDGDEPGDAGQPDGRPPEAADAKPGAPPGAKAETEAQPKPPGRPQWTEEERRHLAAMFEAWRDAGRKEGRDVGLLDEFARSVKDDFATLPDWAAGVLGQAWKSLSDGENWRIAGETLAGTGKDLFVDQREGGKKVASAAWDAGQVLLALTGRAGRALWNDPAGAARTAGGGLWSLVKSVVGVDNWVKVVDGKVPLGERLSRALYGAVDTGLTLWAAGGKMAKWLGKPATPEWKGVLRAPGLADSAADAGRAADVTLDTGKAADAAGDGLKAAGHADELTAAKRTAGRLEQAGDTARRQASWDRAVRTAGDKVDEFERALLGGERDRVRKAMIEIQGDKLALQNINARGDNLKRLYNSGWAEVYGRTDDLARAEIARRYGADPSQVQLVTPTNPSAAVKVGADRDVTYRILRQVDGRAVAYDVDHRVGQGIYDQAFHQAADGARHCPGATPAQFTRNCDQLVTSALHPDAYGRSPTELRKILGQPGALLDDPAQIGQVMTYKSQEVYAQVDEIRNQVTALRRTGAADSAAEIAALEQCAEMLLSEGFRQNTKQWGNQVLRRVAAARAQGHEVRIPSVLEKSVAVLGKVKPGGASPAQAAAELAAMGMSPDKVAYETGKFIETLDALRPAAPPGVWGRLGRALSGLTGGGA